jgi:hypothetical protein
MLHEGAAGARLEEFFEPLRRAFVPELHHRHQPPGPALWAAMRIDTLAAASTYNRSGFARL